MVVVRFRGPQANGMPELHKLMPPLGVLMDRGFKVALVTDGRLSGASGSLPPSTSPPEAYTGGLLAVRDGDPIRVNGERRAAGAGRRRRTGPAHAMPTRLSAEHIGCGREPFGALRSQLSGAEQGACCIKL